MPIILKRAKTFFADNTGPVNTYLDMMQDAEDSNEILQRTIFMDNTGPINYSAEIIIQEALPMKSSPSRSKNINNTNHRRYKKSYKLKKVRPQQISWQQRCRKRMIIE